MPSRHASVALGDFTKLVKTDQLQVPHPALANPRPSDVELSYFLKFVVWTQPKLGAEAWLRLEPEKDGGHSAGKKSRQWVLR